MEKSEAVLFKTNVYITSIEKIEPSNISPAMQSQLVYFKEVQQLLSNSDNNKKIDNSLVDKQKVIEVITHLKHSFYSFFPALKDETAQAMLQIWHKYLKKYKKTVLEDALNNLISLPNEYGRAPNLPDVIYACESIRFDKKYTDDGG